MEDFSYLSEQQRGSLEGLPFGVLLPSRLPEGWKVISLERSEFDDGNEVVLVLGRDKARIRVRNADSGLGDPFGDRVSLHSHPDFGQVRVFHEEDGDFASSWLELDGAWAGISGHGANEQTISEIVESLSLY